MATAHKGSPRIIVIVFIFRCCKSLFLNGKINEVQSIMVIKKWIDHTKHSRIFDIHSIVSIHKCVKSLFSCHILFSTLLDFIFTRYLYPVHNLIHLSNICLVYTVYFAKARIFVQWNLVGAFGTMGSGTYHRYSMLWIYYSLT